MPSSTIDSTQPHIPSNPSLGVLQKLSTELRQDIFVRAADGDAPTFAALQRTSRLVQHELLASPLIKRKRTEAALVAKSLYYNCGHGGRELAVEAKIANHFMFLNKADVPEGGTKWRSDFTKGAREVLKDIEDLEHNQGRKLREKDFLKSHNRMLSSMFANHTMLTDKQIIEKLMKKNNIKESDPYVKSGPEVEKRCERILHDSFGMLFNNPDRYQFPNCLQNLKRGVIQAHLRHENSIDYGTLKGLTSDPDALSEGDCEALARVTLQKNKDYDNEHPQGDGWLNGKFRITEQFGCLGNILHKLTPETKKELVDYALSPASYNVSGKYEADMIGGLTQGARYLQVGDHQRLLTASIEFKAKEYADDVLLQLLSSLASSCKNLPSDRQHMRDKVFDMIKDLHVENAEQIVLHLKGFPHLKSLVSIYPDLSLQQRTWIKDTIKTLDHLPESELDDEGNVWDPIAEIHGDIHEKFGREACIDILKHSFVKNFSIVFQDMKQTCPQDIDDVFNVFSSVSSDFIFTRSARIFSKSGLDCLTLQQFEDVKKRLNAIELRQAGDRYIAYEMEKTSQSYVMGEKMMEIQRKGF